MPLEAFFVGPGETVLRRNEILREVRFPPLPDRAIGRYIKLSPRRAMDIAILGVAVVVVMNDEEQICLEARIGLGGVAPTPIRARESEKVLSGRSIDLRTIENAAKMAAEEVKPISDIRGSADYRKEMTAVLVKRILESLVHCY